MRRASGSTRAFSPRQLPTDHDYAVSTREHQTDQPSRSRLGHHPCCVFSNLGRPMDDLAVYAGPAIQVAGSWRRVLLKDQPIEQNKLT